MTRFTVAFDDGALNDLSEIWCRAENKRLVTAAAREIERSLTVDAQRKGIDYHEGLRTIVVARLRAIYEVSVDDRKVIVWRIREVE